MSESSLLTGMTDPLADAAFLSTSDGSGAWAWAGVQLSADGGIEATQRFADLSWPERRKRLTQEETAWLAAQWDAPVPGSRFEVRFATGTKAAKVQAALLVRVRAATPDAARSVAAERLRCAAGPEGGLPRHVQGRSIDSEAELRGWLGYPSRVDDFVEVRKHLSAVRIVRGGTALPHAVCHGFFDSGGAWDAWWRGFAALPFPVVMSIGFDPYDANDPTFRGLLERRAMELDELSRPGIPSPLNPYQVLADRAAQAAAPSYRRAVARYTGRCFRIRVALASAQPLPQTLVESLAATVSSVTGGVRAVRVATAELDQVVGEFRALGAPAWLPATYQQQLPAPPDGLDQLLHSLADVTEAAAVLSLPVHWPGMPPVFRAGGPLPEE
ncbi:MAG: hypothetical protein ABSA02_20435 [Trebonia sp.]